MQPITLHVIGRFELAVNSRPIPIGISCRRLLTLLALKGGRVSRMVASGTLWPDVTTARAAANLRSVVWRLQRYDCEVIEPSFHDLRLADEVEVDIEEVSALARRLLDRSDPMDVVGLRQAIRGNLFEDVAPELGDIEWLEVERERFRQLRIHSLEALSDQLIATGWYGAAIDAALGVVRADPYRESAQMLLLRAHLAEGNQLEACQRYAAYQELLRDELGVEPSEQLQTLLCEHGIVPSADGSHPKPGAGEPWAEWLPPSRPWVVGGGSGHGA